MRVQPSTGLKRRCLSLLHVCVCVFVWEGEPERTNGPLDTLLLLGLQFELWQKYSAYCRFSVDTVQDHLVKSPLNQKLTGENKLFKNQTVSMTLFLNCATCSTWTSLGAVLSAPHLYWINECSFIQHPATDPRSLSPLNYCFTCNITS